MPNLAHPETLSSVSVLRRLIFISGFDTVMPMTERLPVAFIPEELAVSSVRDDVVNICRLDILAFLHALDAQRMRCKVALPGLLPCSTVASAAGATYLLRMERFVLVTVLGAVGHECCTAWVAAGCIGSCRHRLFPPTKKAPQVVTLQGFCYI